MPAALSRPFERPTKHSGPTCLNGLTHVLGFFSLTLVTVRASAAWLAATLRRCAAHARASDPASSAPLPPRETARRAARFRTLYPLLLEARQPK